MEIVIDCVKDNAYLCGFGLSGCVFYCTQLRSLKKYFDFGYYTSNVDQYVGTYLCMDRYFNQRWNFINRIKLVWN